MDRTGRQQIGLSSCDIKTVTVSFMDSVPTAKKSSNMKQLQRKYGICTETPVKNFLARIVRLFNESTEHKWGLRITQGCSIRCDRSLKTYFFLAGDFRARRRLHLWLRCRACLHLQFFVPVHANPFVCVFKAFFSPSTVSQFSKKILMKRKQPNLNLMPP